jgi:putative beta-lysine N-acetyltransferase
MRRPQTGLLAHDEADKLRLEPTPSEGAPRVVHLDMGAARSVRAVEDVYSDRLRCDHPTATDGAVLGAALIEAAEELDRGRVVVLAPESLADGLGSAGLLTEATMPGFYAGKTDCVVMGYALDEGREALAHPIEVGKVLELIGGPSRPERPREHTMLAVPSDAPKIAELLGETFPEYPTPSHDPAYVAAQIRQGTPFRMVHDGGQLIACASADLITQARTAELTDCATRPAARGRGLMQSILGDLMDDLRELDYPTAFTLARARIPGVNLVFERLGFELRGTMRHSCRIGQGIEDMNVWSRHL